MRQTPDALGAVMVALRRRARLSQRELSRLAEISYTQIGDLERGQGGNPSPLTLRALARGLATDQFRDEGYDPTRADAFYRQLMAAAGYLSGVPVDAPPKRIDEEDVVDWLTARTGDTALSEQLVALAARYPDLDPEDQLVVRRLLTTWIRES
jgi:transcriptional regulator with XRE-family HTH domain